MNKYNFYYIELNNGKYVYRTGAAVSDEIYARKFSTKTQAVTYARKFYKDSDFTVKGGGGLRKDEPYEY